MTTLTTMVGLGAMLGQGISVSVFARARGRPVLHWFAAVCLAGVAYAMVSAMLQPPAVRTEWVAIVTRLGYFSAALYTGLIAHFISRYGPVAMSRPERVGVYGLTGAVMAASAVPGLLFVENRSREFTVFGERLRAGEPTPWAFVAAVFTTLALVSAVSVASRLRSGFKGKPLLIGGLALVVLLGACDMGTTLGLLNSPYVAQAAGIAVCMALSVHLGSEWGEEARQLVDLRRALEDQVDRRSGELAEAREALAHRDRLAMLGRIAASVGHEVNNPLTYVVANLELLADELEADEDRAGLARDALEGANRIGGIVRDLRLLSKPGAHELSPVPVADAVGAAARTLRHRMTRGHRAQTVVPGTLHVLADPTQLTQIFVNLLSNALDAMPEGEDHVVAVHARASGEQVVVTVSDDGPGIPDEIRGRLFDPFQTTSKMGLGLGLTIVKNLVDAFHGTIEVVSPAGGGTRFHLVFPSCDAPSTVPSAAPVDPRTAMSDWRVLVIDDDPEVARAVGRMLAPASVDCVLSGFAGLERLAEDTYDLVLCDVMMPGLSGLDLLERLEASELEMPRFVLMTGGVHDQRTQRSLSEAPCPVLYKPFGLADLARALPADPACARRRAAGG